MFCLISLEPPSLTHGLFRTMLLSSQVFGDFSVIFVLVSSFQLVYSLIPLGLESTLCVIGTLLNLLGFVLWVKMWSVWGTPTSACGSGHLSPAAVGWLVVMRLSIRSYQLLVLLVPLYPFRVSVQLFCQLLRAQC